MSYEALRRGRYSHFNQVYCVTTVTRDRRPLFTDITTARLLVREIGSYPHWDTNVYFCMACYCIWMTGHDKALPVE